MAKKNQKAENPLGGFSIQQLLEELRSRELKMLDEIATKQMELSKASDAVSRRITRATKLSSEIARITTVFVKKPRIVPPKEGTLVKRLVNILSNGRCMTIQEIYDAAKTDGWTSTSNRPRDVVSFTLASNKDLFERVALGTYRAKKKDAIPLVDLDLERAHG
jgi:hypothetical protein